MALLQITVAKKEPFLSHAMSPEKTEVPFALKKPNMVEANINLCKCKVININLGRRIPHLDIIRKEEVE